MPKLVKTKRALRKDRIDTKPVESYKPEPAMEVEVEQELTPEERQEIISGIIRPETKQEVEAEIEVEVPVDPDAISNKRRVKKGRHAYSIREHNTAPQPKPDGPQRVNNAKKFGEDNQDVHRVHVYTGGRTPVKKDRE